MTAETASDMIQSAAPTVFDGADEAIFTLTGARSGPRLVVYGPEDVVNCAAKSLRALPSLVYLRGSIEIRVAEDVEVVKDVDDVLDLSSFEAVHEAKGRNSGYWVILARAASLGMISGRGIPRQMVGFFDSAAA